MTERRTLESLFEDAQLLTDPSERRRWLQTACDGDADLEQRVWKLLESAERSSILDRNLTEVSLAQSYLTGAPIDATIGVWKLIRVLGHGGMGSVYLAEQSEPVRRRAALKMIQLGRENPESVWRFEQEQRALSKLDHPNIARLIDASILETGTSWLVMEYVDGQNLLSFCTRFGLSLDRKLQLFLQCCSAMQHAHQRTIIHRDLKPSNILVSGSESEAVVKVIDFGVAKILEQTQSLAGGPRLKEGTQSGFMPGTLKYMSPEQARNGEVPVDTRTDVYSLGAVLYVLLTGYEAHGNDTATNASAQIDLVKRIIEDEPLSMSRRILVETARSDSRDREVAVKNSRRLKGDLDAIVQKAMAKELHRRYQSVAELSEDIERHLSNLPIQARPHSLGYQISRRLLRNKGICLTVFSIFVSLVTGLLIAISQRNLAESSELSLRSRNYASDLMLASLLIQEGDSSQATAALERQIPATGESDTRSFDWQMLRSQTVSDVRLLHREKDTLYFICPIPRTNEIAICGRGGDIVLLDSESGRVRARIVSGQGEVNGLALSPDGQLLASAGDDGTIAIWDIESGNEFCARVKVHQRQSWQVGWSPDGKILVSCGNEKGLQLRSFPELRSLGTIPTLTDLECLSISSEGLIAAGGEAGALKVVPMPGAETENSKSLETQTGLAPAGHFFNTAAVCFSPDGRFLAVLSQASRIQVLEVAGSTFREVVRLDVVDRVLSVAFSASGEFLAVGMRNGTIEVFNTGQLQTGLQLSFLNRSKAAGQPRNAAAEFQERVESSVPESVDGNFPSGVETIQLRMKSDAFASPNGEDYRFSQLATQRSPETLGYFEPEEVSVSGRTVTLTLPRDVVFAEQNVRAKRIWQAHSSEVRSLCFAADDQSIHSTGGDGTVCLSQISNLQPIVLVKRNVHGMEPLRDDTVLAKFGSSGTNGLPNILTADLIRYGNDSIRSGDMDWPLTGVVARIFMVTADRRNLFVVVENASRRNSMVQSFNVENQKLSPLFETLPGDTVTGLAREGRSDLLVYEVQSTDEADPGKKRSALCIHDLQANRLLKRSPISANGVSDLLISPDHNWCVIDGRPELSVFSLPDLNSKVLVTPRATRNSMMILPDCRTLIVAFADRMLRLYDLTTGQMLQEVPVIGREIEGLALSQDGRTVVGCSIDGTLQCWSTKPFLQTLLLQLPISKLRYLKLDLTGDAIWLQDQYGQLYRMETRLDERFQRPSQGPHY